MASATPEPKTKKKLFALSSPKRPYVRKSLQAEDYLTPSKHSPESKDETPRSSDPQVDEQIRNALPLDARSAVANYGPGLVTTCFKDDAGTVDFLNDCARAVDCELDSNGNPAVWLSEPSSTLSYFDIICD